MEGKTLGWLCSIEGRLAATATDGIAANDAQQQARTALPCRYTATASAMTKYAPKRASSVVVAPYVCVSSSGSPETLKLRGDATRGCCRTSGNRDGVDLPRPSTCTVVVEPPVELPPAGASCDSAAPMPTSVRVNLTHWDSGASLLILRARMLSVAEGAAAVQHVWRRHVACTSGVSGVQSLPATACSADERHRLAALAWYADSYRGEALPAALRRDCQFDNSFRLSQEEVTAMAMEAVRHRFSGVADDGTCENGGDDWVHLYRPRRAEEVGRPRAELPLVLVYV